MSTSSDIPASLPAYLRGKSSQIVVLTVPPGEIAPGLATGTNLYVVSAPCGFLIRMEGGSFIDVQQGCARKATGGATFEYFEAWNPTAKAIKIRVFVGYAEYQDQRQAVVEPATRLACQSGTLAANTPLTIVSALSAADIRRKEVIVSNGSAAEKPGRMNPPEWPAASRQ